MVGRPHILASATGSAEGVCKAPVMWVSGCPLCTSTRSRPIDEILLDEIFAGIKEEWGALPKAIVESHMPASRASILRLCEECGLHYFEPAKGGDAAFYEALAAVLPYEKDRWEFDATAQEIPDGSSVADFGCGDGQFLLTLNQRLSRAVGIDHNSPAVQAAQAAGLEAYDTTFDDFARDNPSQFDVATSFHLVEHVPDVIAVMRPAVEVLRKGGHLFVAVPNRDRLKTEDLEPLDFPPHHLSRWSELQLVELGRRLDLQLSDVQLEPPDRSWHAMFLVRELLPRLSPRLERRMAVIAQHLWLTQSRYQATLNRRQLQARGWHGHGMLGHYRKV